MIGGEHRSLGSTHDKSPQPSELLPSQLLCRAAEPLDQSVLRGGEWDGGMGDRVRVGQKNTAGKKGLSGI